MDTSQKQDWLKFHDRLIAALPSGGQENNATWLC